MLSDRAQSLICTIRWTDFIPSRTYSTPCEDSHTSQGLWVQVIILFAFKLEAVQIPIGSVNPVEVVVASLTVSIPFRSVCLKRGEYDQHRVTVSTACLLTAF